MHKENWWRIQAITNNGFEAECELDSLILLLGVSHQLIFFNETTTRPIFVFSFVDRVMIFRSTNLAEVTTESKIKANKVEEEPVESCVKEKKKELIFVLGRTEGYKRTNEENKLTKIS